MKSEGEKHNFNLFNFYEGYKKLFKVPSKKNIFAPIMFLSVISFATSTEFSYRQTIA